MIRRIKEFIKEHHQKYIAALTYAEPNLTEKDYKYLRNIIFADKNTKPKLVLIKCNNNKK